MANSRIPALVLMHLGVLSACQKVEERPAESGHEALPIAAASGTGAPEALPTSPTASSAAPLGTPTATPTVTSSTPMASISVTPSAPSAVASGGKRGRKLGETCSAIVSCEPGLHCVLGFDGARFTKIGTCGASQPVYEGRPLVVDGMVRVASLPPFAHAAAANTAKVDELRKAALEEHASIAAFARTIAELMALGAPSWLLGATAAALSDEVRHAERTLEFVEKFGGGKGTPAALEAATAPLRSGAGAAEGLYRDVFRGGAVGETLAAARADLASLTEADAELASFRRAVAEDEARHAALALRTLSWLRETFPELTRVRDEEVASFLRGATSSDRALVEPLLATL